MQKKKISEREKKIVNETYARDEKKSCKLVLILKLQQIALEKENYYKKNNGSQLLLAGIDMAYISQNSKFILVAMRLFPLFLCNNFVFKLPSYLFWFLVGIQ